MSAIGNLSINDGQATPAAHTFSVITTTGKKASWADKASGVPIGYTKLSYEVQDPTSASAAIRIRLDLVLPTTATVNGVLTKVRQSSASVVINYAQDSTDQERKDIRAYIANAMGTAVLGTDIQNAEPRY